MLNKSAIYLGLAACTLGSLFSIACVAEDDEYDNVEMRNSEIVENLLAAGYAPETIELRVADSIDGELGFMAAEPQVFVDGDVHVTLEASREMLGVDDDEGFRLWRTPNLVNNNTTVCLVKITTALAPYTSYKLSSTMQSAVDLARDNFNALSSFNLNMVSGNGTLNGSGQLSHSIVGCTYSIFIYQVTSATQGGQAGFPAGGAPYNQVQLYSGLSTLSLDAHEHVVTHEVSHAIGLRHSDWKTRSSCGQNTNEGQSGAVQIVGTDDQTTNSIMASCFSAATNGEFRGQDATAYNAIY